MKCAHAQEDDAEFGNGCGLIHGVGLFSKRRTLNVLTPVTPKDFAKHWMWRENDAQSNGS